MKVDHKSRAYSKRFPYSPEPPKRGAWEPRRAPKLSASRLASAFGLVGGSVVAKAGKGGRVEPVAGCQNRVCLDGGWHWEGFARFLIRKHEAENPPTTNPVVQPGTLGNKGLGIKVKNSVENS